MRVLYLSGGSGSSKLVVGLKEVCELSVACNVSDNAWIYGLYICPDVDITCYALAGILNKEKGYGIQGDSFTILKSISSLGMDAWFELGDRDMATSIYRTEMLRKGKRLTEITAEIASRLGVREKVLPASDMHFETRVVTRELGDIHFQEYWVKHKAGPTIEKIYFKDIEGSEITKEFREEIRKAEMIVIAPANPVTSIMPIVSVPGVKEEIEMSDAKKVAVSPFVGYKLFSGPAARFMQAAGFEPSSLGVAKMYSGLIDYFVISSEDPLKQRIESAGIKCFQADIALDTKEKALALARTIVEI